MRSTGEEPDSMRNTTQIRIKRSGWTFARFALCARFDWSGFFILTNYLPAMLRPPATLRVAIRAGIAMQAGEKSEIRNRMRSAEMPVSKIYSSTSLRWMDLENLFREIDDIAIACMAQKQW